MRVTVGLAESKRDVMRRSQTFFALTAVSILSATASPRPGRASGGLERLPTVEKRLDSHVEQFDSVGRSLMDVVVDLAFKYRLPTGVEYVDRDSVRRGINLRLHNKRVREILRALVAESPDYRVDFSGGLVDIFSPRAREDPSNLLNKKLKRFEVTDLNASRASMELSRSLRRELVPTGAHFEVGPVGLWGSSKISLHLEEARAYEILNAIVTQDGQAFWAVTVPPRDLSSVPRFRAGAIWQVYSLEPAFKDGIIDGFRKLFPPEKKSEKSSQ